MTSSRNKYFQGAEPAVQMIPMAIGMHFPILVLNIFNRNVVEPSDATSTGARPPSRLRAAPRHG